MSDAKLSRLSKLVGRYYPGDAGRPILAVIDACAEKRLLLRPAGLLVESEYREALRPLIGDSALHFLSIASLPPYEDDVQVEGFVDQHYGGFEDMLIEFNLRSARSRMTDEMVISSYVFDAVSRILERESEFLQRMKFFRTVSESSIAEIAGGIVHSVLDDVIQLSMNERSFFPNPVAALTAVSQWTPVGHLDTDVLVLAK